MNITASQLAQIIRQDSEPADRALNRAELWLPFLLAAMKRFEIDKTKAHATYFLAQISLESGGLTRLVEGLNYSADGLSRTWPKRYAVKDTNGRGIPGKPNELAKRLHRNAVAIANNVYAERMGNGPESQGWGWLYRGRGPKQITGHDNYAACGKALGLDLLGNPDLLLKPEHGAMAAGWFWSVNKLAAYADKGDYVGMTKVINGGLIGYDDEDRRDKDTRVDYLIVAERVL